MLWTLATDEWRWSQPWSSWKRLGWWKWRLEDKLAWHSVFYWPCPHNMQTADQVLWNGTVSIRPSVCLSQHGPTAANLRHVLLLSQTFAFISSRYNVQVVLIGFGYQVQRRCFCTRLMGSHRLLLRASSVATFSQFRLALCAVNRSSIVWFCNYVKWQDVLTQYTHTHPFNGLFFPDYPGGPVPER